MLPIAHTFHNNETPKTCLSTSSAQIADSTQTYSEVKQLEPRINIGTKKDQQPNG